MLLLQRRRRLLSFFYGLSISVNFLEKNIQSLRRSRLDFKVTLKHLVFGYKIFDEEYFYLNYLLTFLKFSIYKSYCVSEQKLKHVDVFGIFVKEYNKRIHDKTKSQLLLTIKRNLYNISYNY